MSKSPLRILTTPLAPRGPPTEKGSALQLAMHDPVSIGIRLAERHDVVLRRDALGAVHGRVQAEHLAHDGVEVREPVERRVGGRAPVGQAAGAGSLHASSTATALRRSTQASAATAPAGASSRS